MQTYIHTYIQPYNHTIIQPYNHTIIQPYNHTTIQPYNHTYNHTYRTIHTTIYTLHMGTRLFGARPLLRRATADPRAKNPQAKTLRSTACRGACGGDGHEEVLRVGEEGVVRVLHVPPGQGVEHHLDVPIITISCISITIMFIIIMIWSSSSSMFIIMIIV